MFIPVNRMAFAVEDENSIKKEDKTEENKKLEDEKNRSRMREYLKRVKTNH